MTNTFEEKDLITPMASLLLDKPRPNEKYQTVTWINYTNLSIETLFITPDNRADFESRIDSLSPGLRRVDNCPKHGQEICRCRY